MNRPIRNLAIGCLVLFLALLLNINYVQVFKATDLNDRNDNRRARDAECARKPVPELHLPSPDDETQVVKMR